MSNGHASNTCNFFQLEILNLKVLLIKSQQILTLISPVTELIKTRNLN